MTEEEKIAATAEANARQKSLELLFDYTKFHIGVYLTVSAAYLTLATARFGGASFTIRSFAFWIAMTGFLAAGLAGGIIASSLTQTRAADSGDFLDERIGPWNFRRVFFRARVWTWIEHTGFWIGLIAAVLSFVRPTAPIVPG